ncbi:hypothetical protein E4U21_001470 [Claviceps maximensis]|nr:hypothetical protein E4U21_001470 [Claviceps maximensis]
MSSGKSGITLPSLWLSNSDARASDPHQRIRCQTCMRRIRRGRMEDHMRTHVVPEPERYQRVVRCPRCLLTFKEEHIANHRKTHHLARGMPQSRLVPNGNDCVHCGQHGHECIVAKNPNSRGIKTLRCLQCLASNQNCSFERAFGPVEMHETHPALGRGLLTPPPSPPSSPKPKPRPSQRSDEVEVKIEPED